MPACRKIDTSQTARKKEAIGYYRIESAIALFCALLINIFVVSVFARGFYGKVSTTPHPTHTPRWRPVRDQLLLVGIVPGGVLQLEAGHQRRGSVQLW